MSACTIPGFDRCLLANGHGGGCATVPTSPLPSCDHCEAATVAAIVAWPRSEGSNYGLSYADKIERGDWKGKP